jgi:hypothetical protein
MTYELTASYSTISRWELDFNLDSVFDWYIRWDKLFVKFKELDEDYDEFEPYFSCSDDTDSFKYPIQTDFINLESE